MRSIVGTSMTELNMLKSDKFITETRKINKAYARIDENGIARAGTPYPFKNPIGRNYVKNANFSNVDDRDKYQVIKGWNTGTVDREYIEDEEFGTVLKMSSNGSTEQNGWSLGVKFLLEETIQSGNYVTRSFMVKPVDEVAPNPVIPATSLSYDDLSGSSYFTLNTPIEHGWTKFEKTYYVRDEIESIDIQVTDSIGGKYRAQDLFIANIKVEIGKESTEFCLAVSDGGPEERLYSEREGLIFDAIDFNQKGVQRVEGSLLIRGCVIEGNLPVVIEPETKKTLRNINFL